jgi:V/A-type H+-transporting ATPase subunit E
MNVEQKLDYFTEVIMGEAAAAKRRAAHEKNARIEASVAAALEEAEARIKERVRARMHEIKKTRYKQIAAATASERISLYQKRQQFVIGLFEEIKERLKTFVASDEYKAYLQNAIHQAAQSKEFTIVQLTRRDMEMGVALSDGVTVEMVDTDFIGGFILLNESRTKRIDFSFKTRMVRKMEGFSDSG